MLNFFKNLYTGDEHFRNCVLFWWGQSVAVFMFIAGAFSYMGLTVLMLIFLFLFLSSWVSFYCLSLAFFAYEINKKRNKERNKDV